MTRDWKTDPKVKEARAKLWDFEQCGACRGHGTPMDHETGEDRGMCLECHGSGEDATWTAWLDALCAAVATSQFGGGASDPSTAVDQEVMRHRTDDGHSTSGVHARDTMTGAAHLTNADWKTDPAVQMAWSGVWSAFSGKGEWSDKDDALNALCAAVATSALREGGTADTITTDSTLAVQRHEFINRLADDIMSGKLTEYRKDVLVHCIVDGLQLAPSYKAHDRVYESMNQLERLAHDDDCALMAEGSHPDARCDCCLSFALADVRRALGTSQFGGGEDTPKEANNG